jgi:FMN phosphatase YigB (HAD superfamily)
MSYWILDQHGAIGWDFDNTLIDHPNSPEMHRYIRAHPEKRHLIVTFRSFGWQDEVWSTLAALPGAPARECFSGLVNIDDARFVPAVPEVGAHVEHARAHDAIRIIGGELLITDVESYIEWKGLACRELGLTVLVDDKPEHVLRGCAKHGIVHVHPDELTQWAVRTESV